MGEERAEAFVVLGLQRRIGSARIKKDFKAKNEKGEIFFLLGLREDDRQRGWLQASGQGIESNQLIEIPVPLCT